MSLRSDDVMWDRLFVISPGGRRSLQAQIREFLVSAIAERHFAPGTPVPSTRELAERLGVARNTVVLAYQRLVDEGLLESRERRGYFVPADGGERRAEVAVADPPQLEGMGRLDRCLLRPSRQRNIVKPHDWLDYPFPFLYGQFDPDAFPIAGWRECCRQANFFRLGVSSIPVERIEPGIARLAGLIRGSARGRGIKASGRRDALEATRDRPQALAFAEPEAAMSQRPRETHRRRN